METVYCKLRDPGTTFWDPSKQQKVTGRTIAKLEKTRRVRDAIRFGGLIEVSRSDYERQRKDRGQAPAPVEESSEDEKKEEKKEKEKENFSKSEIEDMMAKGRDLGFIDKDENKEWVYRDYSLGSSVSKAVEALQNSPELAASLEKEISEKSSEEE